jgi:hypothetical protein
MKKKCFILLLSLFLSACTLPNLMPSTAPIPVSPVPVTSQVLTSTPPFTVTPTPATATFTETPTLIYLFPTQAITTEGISTETLSPIITSTLASTPNITDTPPFQTIPKDSLFTTILISGGSIFWGDCEPSFIKITAHITNLANIRVVTIWLRLANKTTGDTTDWGGGAIMNDDGQGNFTYTLTAKSFSHYREYISAWGQYQLVASDIHLQRVGASAQYLNNITVAPCP